MKKCSKCDGSGEYEFDRNGQRTLATCNICGGDGIYTDQPTAALHGSDKQIEWAVQIRRQAAVEMRKLLNKVEEQRAENPAIADQITDLAAKAMAHTSAQWWIDNRASSAQYLCRSEM